MRIFVVVVGVLVGLLLATTLNDALGISYDDKQVPELPPMDASVLKAPSDFEPVDAVIVRDGAPWLRRAADHLAGAVESRSGRRPKITTSTGRAGRVIRTSLDSGAQTFAVSRDASDLVVSADDVREQVRAYYWLADKIRTGAAPDELLGDHPEPRLGMRLVDLGGLGVPDDPEEWDASNYSHNSRRFGQAIGFEPPYVDEDDFEDIESDFTDYLDRMLAYGNNGIVQGGFLNLVSFNEVGDGTQVYDRDSPYRARSEAIAEHMDRLWETADSAGMNVYLSHTELALTPPLEEYINATCGEVDTEDPCTWTVYQQALAELFEDHPSLDGVMIRVGEAGGIYDPDSGMEYTTRLDVRSDEAVRTMLRAFLDVAEEYDKDVIFRSWTVGIGEVGQMHTSTDVYDRVLGDVDSPNLVVSTKYVQGDFYRYLPFNETLYTGDQRRIVEMQDRLEYEGFMAFPDLIGPMHAASLQNFLASNPNIEGVWQWTQNGGPQQAGPMSLYPFYGFWLNIDANVYTTSRFAADPAADHTEVAADWVRRKFGDDPSVVRPLVEMLDISRSAAKKGLYIGAYADKYVRALGLEPPPMMWIFEWDIVSGSNSVLSVMYHSARDDVDGAVAEGRRAVRLAEKMQALVHEVPGDRVSNPELLAKLGDSVDYEVDLLQTLAAWRTTFLRYYQWLDTGSSQARDAWQDAVDTFDTRKAAHVDTYGDDLDFPAYNFVAVDHGMSHIDHNQTMMWLARALLAVLAVILALGCVGLIRPGRMGRLGVPATFVRILISPGGAQTQGRRARAAITAGAALWIGVALLTFSGFRSVHFPVLMAMMILVFTGTTAAINRHVAGTVLARMLAPLVLVGGVVMAVHAMRGPGMFWLRFWTSPQFRTVLTTLCFTLLVWTAYAAYASARRHGRIWALGGVLIAAGGVLVAVGGVPAIAGLETMLTGFNNEMTILPLGLSMTLGITTHLGIPDSLPTGLIAAGAILAVVGVALLGWSAWRTRRPHTPIFEGF